MISTLDSSSVLRADRSHAVHAFSQSAMFKSCFAAATARVSAGVSNEESQELSECPQEYRFCSRSGDCADNSVVAPSTNISRDEWIICEIILRGSPLQRAFDNCAVVDNLDH